MKKYKLINTKTKEETICDKVTINGFDYYVSDGEIKNEKHSLYEDLKGNLHLVGETIRQHNLQCKCILLNGTTFYEGYKRFRKAIATNNPNIDLPKVVDEVELLIRNHFYHEDGINFKRSTIGADEWINGLKTGYNKSQSTHPNSDEDMISFNEWVSLNTNLTSINGEYLYKNVRYTTHDLLQLWKSQQPKIIYYEKQS